MKESREPSEPTGGNSGHVFVVRGRIELVAWDAVIVPTSNLFWPREIWWPALGITRFDASAVSGAGRVRSFATDDGRPAWLLDVARYKNSSVGWLIDGLCAALSAIAAHRPTPGGGRVKPLVALPTLGVGQGGYGGVRGEVVQTLLATTGAFAAENDIDVVFVVADAADYAAFQSLRRERAQTGATETLIDDLATKIRRGEVSLLLGAGVSIPAGLPTWSQLLGTLKAEMLQDISHDDFESLSVLDRAQLLSKSASPGTLGERVAKVAGAALRPTLAHCLLASLKTAKVVTTNYDTLYEDAFKAAHGDDAISVLPREDADAERSWVLKMHGDVADPASIVLSRRDFVRYDAERRPLGSIVQSLMATGHLLVIGASMTDDNVLRLAHEVLALNERNNRHRTLGTVITLRSDEIRSALWRHDFDYVGVSTSLDDATAARDLEIFLDRIAMSASDEAPFLLDARYRELLDDEEVDLAATLRASAQKVRALSSKGRDRWRMLETILEGLGAGQ
ncbi:hypothetical protein OPAG_00214 [Rhodococcus opacus PD630]|nr:hypothetical protein OPAG_00214 [Rhodococcus opacus PD630]